MSSTDKPPESMTPEEKTKMDEMKKNQEAEEKMQLEKQKKQLAEDSKKLEKEKKDSESASKKEKQKVQDMADNQKRKPYKIGIGARLFNLLLGILFVGTTSYLLFDDSLTLGYILSVFAILVLIIAVGRFFSVFYEKNVSGNKRLFNFLTAIVLTVIAIYSLVIPDLGRDVLVFLIAISLIIQGLNRVLLGLFNKVFPAWYRAITFAIGVILVGIPSWVLYENDYENRDLVLLLAYAFFFNGIGRLAKAFSGLAEPKKK